MNPTEYASPMHVENMERTDDVSSKIASGRAYLRVVAYPWGVEFDVCDGVQTR